MLTSPETHTLRDRRPSTVACPACWTMVTKKLQYYTVRKKRFCTGPNRSAKAEQKYLLPARQAPRTIHHSFNRVLLSAWCREYWMIYRGPGFPVFVWFGSSPYPPPPSPVSKLDRRHTGILRERENLLAREGGGRGANSYDSKKVCFSMNQSILSVMEHRALATRERTVNSMEHHASSLWAFCFQFVIVN